MRNEFEKFPEIEEGLRHCHYDESTGIYHADAAHIEEFEWHTQFVNGAWMVFQEQQRKIDAITNLCNNKRGDIHWQVDSFIEEIEELLK